MSAINDARHTSTSSVSINATPLQIEQAKVAALNRQLSRSLEERNKLQCLLQTTQTDLEKQMQETLRLQKVHAKHCLKDATEKQVDPCNDNVKEIKAELASTQNELADEISVSKKRETRIRKLQDQCKAYKEQLDLLKIQQRQDEGGINKQRTDKVIKNLGQQRDELLTVVKKQMKLIDILKKQRVHVEAAALLNITQKDFMKELQLRM